MKQKIVLLAVLLFSLFSCTKIKTDIPVVIEIIDHNNNFSSGKLNVFCENNEIDANSIYHWKNHWVIFNKDIDASGVVEKLKTQFPKLEVKTYDKPFYNFNRQKMTGEKPAEEWENILLSANLVADTTLQNQYMEYHRTQFEKFPEVSKGFCNADFQQLLVYRSGRQLILIVSIPKGKNFAELNPKTTENNPRAGEWNKIMAKYQERLEEAPENVVWVFYNPLKSN